MNSPAVSIYQGDLSLMRIAALAREAWGTNPICVRLWKVMRLWAMFLFASDVIITLYGFTQNAVGTPKVGVGATGMPPIVMLTLMPKALLLGGAIIALFAYPVWAWRKSWRDDPSLRFADITFRERLVGLFTPFVAVCIAAVAFDLIVGKAAEVFQISQSSDMTGGTASRVIFSVFAACAKMSGLLAYMLIYGMASLTLGLRILVYDADPAGARARGSRYVTHSALKLLAYVVIIFFARLFPLIFLAFGPPNGHLSSGESTELLLSLTLLFYLIALDLSAVIILHRILVPIWREDIPLVRQFAFTASAGAPAAPSEISSITASPNLSA